MRAGMVRESVQLGQSREETHLQLTKAPLSEFLRKPPRTLTGFLWGYL